MKKITTIFYLLILIGTLNAQQVNFDSLILPIATPSVEFREYLVQLAWINNPSNRVYDHNINIAEQELKITKLDWANDVGLTFNLNENNLQSQDNSIPDVSDELLEDLMIPPEFVDRIDADRGIVDLGGLNNINNFPRYNFAVTLNLGRIINLNKEIQKSKEALKIEEANLDQRKIEIRSEVYRRFEAYMQSTEIFKIKKESEVDFEQTFKLVEKRFKEGTTDFEQYSRASSTYTNARESTLSAKAEITQLKIDLEEIIGIPLEYASGFHQQALQPKIEEPIEQEIIEESIEEIIENEDDTIEDNEDDTNDLLEEDTDESKKTKKTDKKERKKRQKKSKEEKEEQ